MQKKIQSPRLSGNYVLLSYSLFILFSININGQGFRNGSGNTFSLGSLTLSLSGNWSNSSTFTAGTSTIIFNGTGGSNQTITNSSGETFYNLTVNKSTAVVQLLNNISVTNQLTISGGDLDLNGKTVSLGTTGTLSETAGNTVKGTSGTITAARTLNAPSSNNVAGMGAEITSGANLGSTSITRGHAVQTGNGNSSVLRYFDISPTTNTGLNASLVFHYDDSELNSLNEAELELYKSTDSGNNWTLMGGTVSTTNNTVTLAGLDGFSRWTLGGSSLPLPVELTSFTAEVNETEVLLNWETETEVDNYGFEVERKSPSLNPLQGGDFEKIGFVEGHGNSNSPKEYSFIDKNITVGKYSYRLKQIDNNGSFYYFPNAFGIEVEVEVVLPTEFELFQNYPNPFNPSSKIKFNLPEAANVNLSVYNALGEFVMNIVDEKKEAGYFEYIFNGSNLSSGMYIYRLTAGNKFSSVKKMILLK